MPCTFTNCKSTCKKAAYFCRSLITLVLLYPFRSQIRHSMNCSDCTKILPWCKKSGEVVVLILKEAERSNQHTSAVVQYQSMLYKFILLGLIQKLDKKESTTSKAVLLLEGFLNIRHWKGLHQDSALFFNHSTSSSTLLGWTTSGQQWQQPKPLKKKLKNIYTRKCIHVT